ncbi:MAG: carbohydrate-binding domain-containing protein [Actinomycetia bacterium]|nr:carbohydrate-binding domain-containing protein [Actinomycetes bacterium]
MQNFPDSQHNNTVCWRRGAGAILAGSLLLAACGGAVSDTDGVSSPSVDLSSVSSDGSSEATAVVSAESGTETTATSGSETADTIADANQEDHDDISDSEWSADDETNISLDGSTVTITSPGTYHISGVLDDGQVFVDSPENGIVRLVLDGVDITNTNGAAIEIAEADEVVVVLAEGSENRLADTARSTPDDEVNAALYSMADLTITGIGSLTVVGSYDDAITSKDGLVIGSGALFITAVDDAIRGKDYVVIEDGTIEMISGGDGIKSDNEEDVERGYIAIGGGTITVDAGADAVDAATDLLVTGGSLFLSASGKGLKGDVVVVIDGGDLTIDTTDDAVHSNTEIVINGGEIQIATDDDAVHADSVLVVNGGVIDIAASYEGLEADLIDINGGLMTIVSSDDAVNSPGGPGITIDGGTIVVDAEGDGVDVNGPVTMTDGVLIINGPTASNNGALDVDGGWDMQGGFIVAVGSSNMAGAPDVDSVQGSLLSTFSTQTAGTVINIESADGTNIVTFTPSKAYESIVVSDPDLSADASYEVSVGGTTTSADEYGLSQAGDYEGGSVVDETTTAEAVSQNRGRGRRGP